MKNYRVKCQLWAILIFYMTVLPFSFQYSIATILLSSIAIIIATFLSTSRTKAIKPIKLILLTCSPLIAYTTTGNFRSIEFGATLLIFLAILKAFELKRKRDEYTYILICNLLMVVQLLKEDSLLILLYVFIYEVFCFYYLIRTKEMTNKRLKDFLKIITFSIPIALVLFVLFPRVELKIAYLNKFKLLGSTGFSEELTPGSISELVKDDTPVFHAFNLSGESFSPVSSYWRGKVLSRTTGLTWKPGAGSRKEFESVTSTGKYRIEFEKTHYGPIYTLKNTVKVKTRKRANTIKFPGNTWSIISLSSRPTQIFAETGEYTYKKISDLDVKNYTQLPDTNHSEKFSSLINQLNKKSDKIKAVFEFFEKNEFKYTLTPGTYSDIEEFLFERKLGFCEHYAASFAYLLRRLKIPSRVIIGFQGGIKNIISESIIVRNEDAHAWVEYWDGNKWKQIDPVNAVEPSRIRNGAYNYYRNFEANEDNDIFSLLSNSNRSLIDRIKRVSLMIYYDLNTSFINYDLTQQQNIFKSIKTKINPTYILVALTVLILTLLIIIYRFYIFQNRPKISKTTKEFIKIKKHLNINKRIDVTPLELLEISNNHQLKEIVEIINDLKYNKDTIHTEDKLKTLVKKYLSSKEK